MSLCNNQVYDGDLHAKRVLSLANGTLGVLSSASLAVHAVGHWAPYMVGSRPEVLVALDWTSFARDGHETLVLNRPGKPGG